MATEHLFTEQPHCSNSESVAPQDKKPLTSSNTATEEAKKPLQKVTSVQIREPEDIRGYTVLRVEEKHGPLHNAIPCMPLPLAVLCCILNIVAPGIGTLISAPTVLCCATTRLKSKGRALGLNIVSALLQMITFLLIVGWIWSILWGMTFVQLSWESRQKSQGRTSNWSP